MDQKRNCSQNWDEEEKLLFRSVLKEYAGIIENKSLDTNTIKIKTKAWEEVHKKFNELNSRHRQLSQLKIQWKTMKVNARKKYSTFKKELSKTGGGARPATPNDGVIEIKDLLNTAELLRDHNIYDSDGIDAKPMTYVVKASDIPCVNENINPENQQIAEIIIETIDVDAQENTQEFTSSVVSQDEAIVATPINKNMGMISAKVPKRKLISNNKKNHDDYVNSMISHSKMLKEEEHRRRMEMAEEEHSIKIKIHKEKLKSAILEREILELRKVREEQN